MNEATLGTLLVFAELGAVLSLLFLVWFLLYLRNARKEGKTTKELIEYINNRILAHREQLNDFYNATDMEQGKMDINIQTLIKDEQEIYKNLVAISINKDTQLLVVTTEEINALINDYVRLLIEKKKVETQQENERKSREILLKKENEALRVEVVSLQNKLTAATETIENMLTEYSSMYEGGRKEGEQRVKNEMHRLEQSLGLEKARASHEMKELDDDNKNDKE